jgi:menaquinone-dependent protoporphyrinogen IX oxidase
MSRVLIVYGTGTGCTAGVAQRIGETIASRGVGVDVFAGWNEPKRFSLVERTIMKVMKAPEGDFRDWEAIDSWAEQVAPRLGVVG